MALFLQRKGLHIRRSINLQSGGLYFHLLPLTFRGHELAGNCQATPCRDLLFEFRILFQGMINNGLDISQAGTIIDLEKGNPPFESRRVRTQPFTKTSSCSSLLFNNSFIFVLFMEHFPKIYRLQIKPTSH